MRNAKIEAMEKAPEVKRNGESTRSKTHQYLLVLNDRLNTTVMFVTNILNFLKQTFRYTIIKKYEKLSGVI